MGGAISSGVVAAVVIVSGIKDADTAADVSGEGLLMMKIAMMIFPLLCIMLSYVIYRKKYKIDSRFYARILSDLRERGELLTENQEQA
jgi:melibiose permease/lactose/raffinose/galactose permease